jgi:uncharacterized protein YycO
MTWVGDIFGRAVEAISESPVGEIVDNVEEQVEEVVENVEERVGFQNGDPLTALKNVTQEGAYTGSKGTNDLDLSQLESGDLIFVSGAKTGEEIVPGDVKHVAIYAGDGMMIESQPGTGVREVPVELVHNADKAAIYRPDATDTQKESAVRFAEEQIGKPYDYNWTGKQIEGASYYCSELAWAAYEQAGGPHLDGDDNSPVSPQEIADDDDVTLIAHSS